MLFSLLPSWRLELGKDYLVVLLLGGEGGTSKYTYKQSKYSYNQLKNTEITTNLTRLKNRSEELKNSPNAQITDFSDLSAHPGLNACHCCFSGAPIYI